MSGSPPRRPPRHVRVQSTQHQRSALAKRYTLRPKSFKISEHSDITRSLTMGSPSPMGGEDVSLDYRSTRERRTSSAAAQATQKKTQHSAADTACAVGSSDWGAMTAQSLTPEEMRFVHTLERLQLAPELDLGALGALLDEIRAYDVRAAPLGIIQRIVLSVCDETMRMLLSLLGEVERSFNAWEEVESSTVFGFPIYALEKWPMWWYRCVVAGEEHGRMTVPSGPLIAVEEELNERLQHLGDTQQWLAVASGQLFRIVQKIESAPTEKKLRASMFESISFLRFLTSSLEGAGSDPVHGSTRALSASTVLVPALRKIPVMFGSEFQGFSSTAPAVSPLSRESSGDSDIGASPVHSSPNGKGTHTDTDVQGVLDGKSIGSPSPFLSSPSPPSSTSINANANANATSSSLPVAAKPMCHRQRLCVATARELRAMPQIAINVRSVLKRHKRKGHFSRHWMQYSLLGLGAIAGARFLYKHSSYCGSDDLRMWYTKGVVKSTEFVWEHLIDPLRVIYRELFVPAELDVLKIEAEVEGNRASLVDMIVKFSHTRFKDDPEKLAIALEAAKNADMDLLMKDYVEKVGSSFLYNPLMVGDLIQSLLIQIQKLKLDIDVEIMDVERLIKSNELNIQMMAMFPIGMLCGIVVQGAKSWWGWWKGKAKRKKYGKRQPWDHARDQLRKIDRILTFKQHPGAVLTHEEQGYLLYALMKLHRVATNELRGGVRRRMLEDLQDLKSSAVGVKQKLMVCNRIYRTYPQITHALHE